MFYENELSFLCDTFKKCRVGAACIGRENPKSAAYAAKGLFDSEWLRESAARLLPQSMESGTLYRVSDTLGFSYMALLLPNDAVLFIGPYLSAMPFPERLLEIGEANGVSPQNQRYLEEYYSTVPVLSESDRLLLMLDTFCERIWKRPCFLVVDLGVHGDASLQPLRDAQPVEALDDVLVSMKAMETRYGFENELIRAVEQGQLQMEKQLLAALSDKMFEKRVADPLRNAKNYAIIMNTLLRKAAERGGVHPVYLDKTSSAFALRIEQLPSLNENAGLMREMFRSYCRLVRKHSMKHLSLLVQKTVLLIDSNLSGDIAPSSLAHAQGVSLGYLSATFRREMGKTISEYIRKKRMEHAAHLLETTNLQIQTVALHCGIMDVQYFSKLFKRHTEKTPREYRESFKRTGEL